MVATKGDWSRKVVRYDAWPIRVDYFSLDVEGAELDVLRTLPWDKVDIRYKYIFVSATLPVILSFNRCLWMCCNGDLGPYRYSMFRKKYEKFCDPLLWIAEFGPNTRPTSETEYFTECTCICWICERSHIRPLSGPHIKNLICERSQIRPRRNLWAFTFFPWSGTYLTLLSKPIAGELLIG
jgi:hypothetical protein